MVVRLARAVHMREHGLHRAERFNDNIVDLASQLLHIISSFSQIAPHKGQRAFMPNIVAIRVIVEYEILVVLVDRVVRQMHEQVLQIALERRLVQLGGKASQPLVEHINSKRIHSEH